MAESRKSPTPTGVEKSASLKNLANNRGESPTGKPPSSNLVRNPSQKAGEISPLARNKNGSMDGGSSIKR